MTLNKQTGNMYGFVTHTWNPLIGECPHRCSYCSTKALRKRFPSMRERYTGPLRLDNSQFHDLGTGKTIFVCGQNDLFATGVSCKHIKKILKHCRDNPDNHYFFQTKNPEKMEFFTHDMPRGSVVCVTAESNKFYPKIMKGAPIPSNRLYGLCLGREYHTLHITIEPILDFDLDKFSHVLTATMVDQVNIGADSQGHDLPEPSWNKTQKLIQNLRNNDIKIHTKDNLKRLKGK